MIVRTPSLREIDVSGRVALVFFCITEIIASLVKVSLFKIFETLSKSEARFLTTYSSALQDRGNLYPQPL